MALLPSPLQVDSDLAAFKKDAYAMLNKLKVAGASQQGDASQLLEQESLIMK